MKPAEIFASLTDDERKEATETIAKNMRTDPTVAGAVFNMVVIRLLIEAGITTAEDIVRRQTSLMEAYIPLSFKAVVENDPAGLSDLFDRYVVTGKIEP